MLRAEIVPALPEHIEYVAEHMRQADQDELWASSHSLPLESLVNAKSRSVECWTGLINGEPICVFGVTPISLVTGLAAPWMLGTDKLEDHAMTFLRRSRRVVASWKEEYRLLFNYVDARNTVAIQWLDWLGFDIQEAAVLGAESLPFHRFEYVRK